MTQRTAITTRTDILDALNDHRTAWKAGETDTNVWDDFILTRIPGYDWDLNEATFADYDEDFIVGEHLYTFVEQDQQWTARDSGRGRDGTTVEYIADAWHRFTTCADGREIEQVWNGTEWSDL